MVCFYLGPPGFNDCFREAAVENCLVLAYCMFVVLIL